MSVKYISKVFDSDLSPRERLIMLAIADCANDKGIAWPGYIHLMEKTGYTKPTIAAGLKELKKSGWIKVENHSVFGEGKKVNLYIIQEIHTKSKEGELLEDSNNLSHPTKSKAALLPKVKSTHPKSKAALHEPSLEPSYKRKPSVYSRICVLKPDYFSDEEWRELYQHRSQKKAAQSVRAYNGLITEFDKAHLHGMSADDILNAMSTGKGWAGFKYEWVKNKNNNGGFQKRRHTTIDAFNGMMENLNGYSKAETITAGNSAGAAGPLGLPLPK